MGTEATSPQAALAALLARLDASRLLHEQHKEAALGTSMVQSLGKFLFALVFLTAAGCGIAIALALMVLSYQWTLHLGSRLLF